MSLVGQLEAVIEVKASATKIHEVFSCRPHVVTIVSPQSVQSCELIEGEWGKPGTVICWTFTRYAGSPQIAKELIEVIDNENYLTTFKLIEGCGMEELYKSFYSIAKVTQNDGGSLVHFTYKYEKKNEDVPDLESSVLEMMINVVKNIDAYLTQNKQTQVDSDQVLQVKAKGQEIESPSH